MEGVADEDVQLCPRKRPSIEITKKRGARRYKSGPKEARSKSPGAGQKGEWAIKKTGRPSTSGKGERDWEHPNLYRIPTVEKTSWGQLIIQRMWRGHSEKRKKKKKKEEIERL